MYFYIYSDDQWSIIDTAHIQEEVFRRERVDFKIQENNLNTEKVT